MARIHELIRQIAATNPHLAADVGREVDALAGRRAFGLNFERHTPEEVELPGRPVRRGDKVHLLPPRGQSPTAENALMWRVMSVTDGIATIVRHPATDDVETTGAAVDDLVVVAEFRDPIYPGLVSTGKVERGGDKPYHAVINAENFHALQTLLFTHRGKVDAIYIDPPYNTGARDWKYNNDYVENDDLYRHSKWLAFMERRLLLATELLNPDDSVLIVTIDEKEYMRLGLLLGQIFPNATIQMVSIAINPKGRVRPNQFTRVDEFAYFVSFGNVPNPEGLASGEASEIRWPYLRRSDTDSMRGKRPRQFYPVYIDVSTSTIRHIGSPLTVDESRHAAPRIDGCVAVFPVREDGQEMEWGLTGPSLKAAAEEGFVRVSAGRNEHQPFTISYLTIPAIRKVKSGEYLVANTRADGSKVVIAPGGKASRWTTVWSSSAHDAGAYGKTLLASLLPGRSFPFPKSLYAVEDAIRFCVADKPSALIVDFFAGSGTTTHAVARLNKQDGGCRHSITVTNNEVSADEQTRLRGSGLRPGDLDWEALGICDYITKPRIEAAFTGLTPDGDPIKGSYRFTDECPMADGFEENVEFFTLTYEAPLRVQANRDFERIAPLLWMRSGSRGRRIETVPDVGWDVADAYGVLVDLDHVNDYVEAVRTAGGLTHAFIVTDDERLFQAVVRDLPSSVEPVRLYESYLTNLRIDATRAVQR